MSAELLFVILAAGAINDPAACVAPAMPMVPDGNTATPADMDTAAQALLNYQRVISEYQSCLVEDYDRRREGRDSESIKPIFESFQARYNTAFDQRSGVLDCYENQRTRFLSSGGGKQARPADCSAELAEAAKPAPANVILDVTDRPPPPGRLIVLDGVRWRESLERGASHRCKPGTAEMCAADVLRVGNESGSDLICRAIIRYPQPNAHGVKNVERDSVVLRGKKFGVARFDAPAGLMPEAFEARCRARPALPSLDRPAHCKMKIERAVRADDFYPQASRDRSDAGAVVVDFTAVGETPGVFAKDVVVAGSSLYPELDAAAVRAVSAMQVSSNCPGTRFRSAVTFSID